MKSLAYRVFAMTCQANRLRLSNGNKPGFAPLTPPSAVLTKLPVSEPGFQVIARRWRPRCFDELVGQEHIVRTLRNALETKRMAHAYLFIGPRGTGKTTTARILAKALNCAGGPKPDFSLDDPVCLAIEKGNCLDVVEIDAASNRGIEDAKRIRDECQYAPSNCPFKVFIIDEVHQLSKDAFNALLKTLEEPPPWVKFILATTEADKILPTITSRCQRLEFHPISEEVIAAQLARIVKADGVTADQHALTAIARLASGGMRDSQSILDQVISFSGKKITEADVLSIYGLASVQQVTDLCQGIATCDGKKVLALCDAFHAEGRDLLRVLADLQVRVRAATLDSVRSGGTSAQLGAPLALIVASGLFAFEFAGGSDAARVAFIDSLALFGIGYSWGGFESLALPVDPASLRTATRWRDRSLGVAEGSETLFSVMAAFVLCRSVKVQSPSRSADCGNRQLTHAHRCGRVMPSKHHILKGCCHVIFGKR